MNYFQKKNEKFADALINEGTAYYFIAKNGINTQKNLEKAMLIFQSSRKIVSHGRQLFSSALINEACTRNSLADIGIESQQNLEEVIKLYKEVQGIFPKGSADYA
ncbi:MAG: hypothetical protein MUO40_09405 [Anaerolineaceae bacterium]|nr:hypothetical protein [Anaerolineaceae bacterium]